MNECISTKSVFQFQTKDESIMSYCRELWESENKTFDVVRMLMSVNCLELNFNGFMFNFRYL